MENLQDIITIQAPTVAWRWINSGDHTFLNYATNKVYEVLSIGDLIKVLDLKKI